MIDLHSHILPGIDDGAKNLDVSLEMARASVLDGVTVLACTPHIMPGVYGNTGPQIRLAVQALQAELDANDIALQLVSGSDAHMVADMVDGLRSGRILTLADTRYVLVEPPHHIQPINIQEFFFKLLIAGFQPILTHPERLHWIENNYETMVKLSDNGVWMQITAGSLTGAFGQRPLYWAQKMLDEGRVHILASDAHSPRRRPPNLGQGRDFAAKRVGEIEANHLVQTRPAGILANLAPDALPLPNPDLRKNDALGFEFATAQPQSQKIGRDGSNSGGGLRGIFSGMQRFIGRR